MILSQASPKGGLADGIPLHITRHPGGPHRFRQIAASLPGPVDWQDAHTGFCRCPGEHQHTTPTKDRDCRVFLDAEKGQAPTVFCFHGSCNDVIIATNFRLRSEIGKVTFQATGHLSDGQPKVTVTTDPFKAFMKACFRPEDILSIGPGMIPDGETRAIP